MAIKLYWPLPGHQTITSPYGYRKHPVTGEQSFHGGVDIAASTGDPVYAAATGKVVCASYQGTYGNLVRIVHFNNIVETRYAHLSKFAVAVGKGTVNVQAGQLIGYVGATGRVTGPHLHFEVRLNGKTVNPLGVTNSKILLDKYTRQAIEDEKINWGEPMTGLSTLDIDTSDGWAATLSSLATGGLTVTKTAVPHIPQTEKVWTAYTGDGNDKPVDRYAVALTPYGGEKRDITSRVADLRLTDDSDAVCTELNFTAIEADGDRYLGPMGIACGDRIDVVNAATGELVFTGMVETVGGAVGEAQTVRALDDGRILTTNTVVCQFNNVSAKAAIEQIAAKLDIKETSIPALVSSVNSTERANASDIIQAILSTVESENGIHYFPRVTGSTLVIRSFAQTCIVPWCRQADNVQAFPCLNEAGDLNYSASSEALRNIVSIYSSKDDTITALATARDADSIARYGARNAAETYSDSDSVSAAEKAKRQLAKLDQLTEELSLTAYGSDRVVAGVRLADPGGVAGEFWVTAVTHDLTMPHRMELTLRRCTA